MARMLAPLRGIRVLEFAGLAPVPMVGLMLKDHGADVIRVDQFAAPFPDVLAKGKRSIAVNLKQSNPERLAAAHAIINKLVAASDVLLDPFRPGTLEALGYGPSRLHELNSGLVIARVTGYGGRAYSTQYERAAGHDINYVAMSGLLSLMSRSPEAPPQPPLNLLGDFCGGSALAFAGILLALLERGRTSRGSVVDVSMTAGASYLGTLISNLHAANAWSMTPFLRPGGAPYYDTYKTKDGRFLALGAIEPQFYAQLISGLCSVCSVPALEKPRGILTSTSQHDQTEWGSLRDAIATVVGSIDCAQWSEVFAPRGPYADACVTPVLTMAEASAFLSRGSANLAAKPGAVSAHPPPAPRLYHDAVPAAASEEPTPRSAEDCVVPAGTHTRDILLSLGYTLEQIGELTSTKIVKVTDGATLAPRL